MSAYRPCPDCDWRDQRSRETCSTCKGWGRVPIPGTCCTGYHQGRGHDGTCTARLSRSAGS